MLLSELLSPVRIRVPLGSHTKTDVLRELVNLVADPGNEANGLAILASVNERERVLSTGIGGGIAIPHGKTPHADQLVLAAGVSPNGVEFDALDGKLVHLFFLLVGPESASGAHVKALGRISRLLRREALRAELIASLSADAFLSVIQAAEAS
ncbi:MAG: PTS sugar transporter subunit IIA [Gemmatimonadaceae bacterium]